MALSRVSDCSLARFIIFPFFGLAGGSLFHSGDTFVVFVGGAAAMVASASVPFFLHMRISLSLSLSVCFSFEIPEDDLPRIEMKFWEQLSVVGRIAGRRLTSCPTSNATYASLSM